jgi:hypothetical protein
MDSASIETWLALDERDPPCPLPGLLGHPLRARIRRASRDMNTAGAQFDEEEHVQLIAESWRPEDFKCPSYGVPSA